MVETALRSDNIKNTVILTVILCLTVTVISF